MHRRLLALAACGLAAFALPRAGRACAVCATVDPTLAAPGAEQPFARRLRLALDLGAGRALEATPAGRELVVDDRRLELAASYGLTRDLLLSVVLPALERTLHDGAAREDRLVAGDAEVRAFATVWRGSSRRRLGLLAGLKLPTAAVEDDARGAPLPAELEPGCSSLVPYLGAAYALGRGRWSGQASAALYLPFAVRAAPHPGYSLRMVTWVELQPARAFAGRLGFDARLDATGELSPNVPDPSSGGFIGYVAADLLVSPATDLVLSLSGLFPVAQALVGDHREGAIASLRAAYDF